MEYLFGKKYTEKDCHRCLEQIKTLMRESKKKYAYLQPEKNSFFWKNDKHMRLADSLPKTDDYEFEYLDRCPLGLEIPDHLYQEFNLKKKSKIHRNTDENKAELAYLITDLDFKDPLPVTQEDRIKQCQKCVEQISSLMSDFKKAALWTSPHSLYVDCDYLLSTMTPLEKMRLYLDTDEIGDTDQKHIELSECPIGLSLSHYDLWLADIKAESKEAYFRYVNGMRPREYQGTSLNYPNPSEVKYLVLEKEEKKAGLMSSIFDSIFGKFKISK